MCNCKEEVAIKIKNIHGLNGRLTNYELITGKSYSIFETTSGEETPVLHSYCPHCGKKYEGDD